MTDVDAAVKRLHENLASFDAEAAFELESEGERADLWTEIDVNVDDVRAILDALAASEAARIKAEGEVERLREALEPFVADFEKHRDAYSRRYPDRKLGYVNFDKMPSDWSLGPVDLAMSVYRRARAALRREPSTALEPGKTEGGGE